MPLSGFILIALFESFARIDKHAVRLAWHANLLRLPFPSSQRSESSLPYIAPLAICGGVLPAIVIRATHGDTNAAFIATAFGAPLFYFGFALDDLRQFIWRQEQLARECCRGAGVNPNQIGELCAYSPSGLLLAGAALTKGLDTGAG